MNVQLDINKMNLADPVETRGYGLLFFAEANRLGLFYNPAPDTKAKSAAVTAAKSWLTKAERAMATMKAMDALETLSIYDLLHKIVFRKPVFSDFRDKYILQAFEALKQGDRSIDRYVLFDCITDASRQYNDSPFLSEPLRWQRLEMAQWVEDFSNKENTDIPPYETLQRATIISRTDFASFGLKNKAAVKEQIKRRSMLLIDNLSERTSKNIGYRTYIIIRQLLMEFIDDYDTRAFNRFQERICKAIINAPDIDIYTKIYYKEYLM